jgi:hypothetical protein
MPTLLRLRPLLLAALPLALPFTLHGRFTSSSSGKPPYPLWIQPRVLFASTASTSASSSASLVWPIDVPFDDACPRVGDVAVDVVGLQHPDAPRLRLTLHHGSSSAVVARGAPSARRVGEVRELHAGVARRSAAAAMGAAPMSAHVPLLPAPPVWSFADKPPSANLARLAVGAAASSTLFGAGPDRLVDGVDDGFFSTGGLFHSGPVASLRSEGATWGVGNWAELDLGAPTDVGSVRLLDRVADVGRTDGSVYSPDVLVVRTRSFREIVGGTFRLAITLPPPFSDTDFAPPSSPTKLRTEPIPFDAPATRAEATAAGLSPDTSLQALLEALPLAGKVAVTRSPSPSYPGDPGAGLAPGPATTFEWRVTFLNRAGLPHFVLEEGSLRLTPADPSQNVTAEFALPRGRAHTWFDDRGRAADVFSSCQGAGAGAAIAAACPCGFAPGLLILSTDPLGNRTAGDAAAHPSTVFVSPLECPSSPFRREWVIDVPGTRRARYVRVQRTDRALLWVAELQVFAERLTTLRAYAGGGAIAPGAYEAEESLRSAFAGGSAEGPWVLEAETVRDAGAGAGAGDGGNGMGGGVEPLPASLSLWLLRITCEGGEGVGNHSQLTVTHEGSAEVRLRSFPRGGHLTPFLVAVPAGSDPPSTNGTAFAGAPSPHPSQCLPGARTRDNGDGSQSSCAPENTLLKHRTDGASIWAGDAGMYLASVDAAAVAGGDVGRLSWRDNRHTVLYDPVPGFEGEDVFAYSTTVLPGGGGGGGGEEVVDFVQVSVGGGGGRAL